MFQAKDVEKFKQYIFFWKFCLSWDNVEKYSTARHTTGGNTIWHTSFTCQI